MVMDESGKWNNLTGRERKQTRRTGNKEKAVERRQRDGEMSCFDMAESEVTTARIETKTWAYEAKEWEPSLKRRGNSGHLNKSVTVMWLTDRFSAGSRPSRAVTQVEETARNRAPSKKTLTFKESSRERKGLQQGEDLISDRSRTVTNDYFHYLIV